MPNDSDSLSALEKDPRPGPLFEGNPVGEGTTRRGTGDAINHLILCHPLLLLPSIFPNIRVFFDESALCIRWLKYWSFSFSPSNEYSGLISFRTEHIQGCKPGEKNVTV